jgi:hypothetical protein
MLFYSKGSPVKRAFVILTLAVMSAGQATVACAAQHLPLKEAIDIAQEGNHLV